MLTILASTVFISGIGGLVLAIIGIVLVYCLVMYIMRQAGAPPAAFTILNIAGALILLLIVVAFFFQGSGPGPVIIR